MKKMIIAMVMLAIALMVSPAHADIAYGGFLFDGLNASGSPISSGTYMMLVDLDGDGWNGTSYTTQATTGNNYSSWLWDSNDLILDRGQISNGEAYPYASLSSANIPSTYTAGVDNIYLFWFTGAYSASAAGPGSNINYGVELLGKVGADPGDYTYFAEGGIASLKTLGTVVPEPISVVLAMIGGGAMFIRKRFFGLSA